MNRKRVIAFIILIVVICVVFMSCATKDGEQKKSDDFVLAEVMFKNEKIERAVRDELRNENVKLTVQDLKNVEKLSLDFLIISMDDIEELTNLVNLSSLEIEINDEIDISPLKNLNSLHVLKIEGKPKTLAFLSEINQLEYLELLSIEDFSNIDPIKKMPSLTGLGVKWIGPNCVAILKETPNIKEVVFWEGQGTEDDFPIISHQEEYSMEKIRKQFPKVSFQGNP